MSVKLRTRENKDGSKTLLLDIYHNGKRHCEFLAGCKQIKPKNLLEREENKKRLALAKEIAVKRAAELQATDYDITPEHKKNIDFLQFFEGYVRNYEKLDKRVMLALLSKFKDFMKEENMQSITAKQVNELLVFNFKEYLEQTLNGETPHGYFKRFKKFLKHGVRSRVFTTNPANDVTIKSSDSIKKDVLTFDEIQLLASTPCTNETMKKAFLFSCLTGLRFCDVSTITWQNINGNELKFSQQKTSKQVTINLNADAIQLIGTRKKQDGKLFPLPSSTACNKGLKTWCFNSGITKKITWHCSRHSFVTNIIFYGADVNTARDLAGHSSLDYTQRYARVVKEMKEKAVSNLPSINMKAEVEYA